MTQVLFHVLVLSRLYRVRQREAVCAAIVTPQPRCASISLSASRCTPQGQSRAQPPGLSALHCASPVTLIRRFARVSVPRRTANFV